jgi:hypothetical protein
MRVIYLLLTVSMAVSSGVFAQDAKKQEDKQAAYTRTINERSQKIVNTLGIPDSSKAKKVCTIIADQYRNLNDIHTRRDNKIKELKSQLTTDKDQLASKIKETEEEANKELDKLHKKYLSKLSKKLTAEQVTKVKDGMTYNVLPITYKGYQDMILTLTEEQKAKIYEWLVEAREHAMDAESSDKKHWWFGKYKGRINNYLAAAGYDLKKAGEDWQKRLKEKSASAN